jgi:senataxin
MAGPALVHKLEELSAHQETHWFCPRAADDNTSIFYDEDFTNEELEKESEQDKKARQNKVKEARERRDAALEVCIILAFDGADAVTFQERLKQCLRTQLSRCDICIREFHRGRRLLRTQLETEYAGDEVLEFMKTFDSMNQGRIVDGLNEMSESLMDLAPEERKITSVSSTAMYALFESLHCVPFLRNEDLLQKHFDKPFRLVQSKKKFTLPNFAPGMTAFLYSNNPDRSAWAERNVTKLKRPMLKEEFEFAVKPFLEAAMLRVHVVSLELEFLPRFWKATRQLIANFTKPVITNNLRAMDANLFTLALDHFQVDAPHFADLLNSIQILLQKSPADFWEAVGAATPQNVVETICRAPQLEKLLKTTIEIEDLRLGEKMEWVAVFIRSVKPANLVPPLRTLLDQLLHRFQKEEYSNYASKVTWEAGLACLRESIQLITAAVDGGPVYTHLIEAVAKDHITVILQELQDVETMSEMQIRGTKLLGLEIIEHILAMDVKSLIRDRIFIVKHGELDHEIGVTSLSLWKFVLRAVKAGGAALPTAILAGMKSLVQLEKFPPKLKSRAPKPANSWDEALARVHNHVIADFLDRLDAFSPDQLAELYQEPAAARGLMSLLLNADDTIHQAALSTLKTLSGEDNRRETLMHITTTFLATTLDGTADALKLIVESRSFGPCRNLMKICRDMFSCLCDSQDGILRSRDISENDQRALRRYWSNIWSAIEMIFDRTEEWSGTGLEKAMMQEFCRETMDFAEYAFEQYAVIAGVLELTRNATDIGKQLLQYPNRAFKNIMKWLRLRDEYLISKAVQLTSNILMRLQEVGIKVSTEASNYIEDIVTSGASERQKIKTKLTMNHKAELQRALERHLGESLADVIETEGLVKKKQSSLHGWALSERGSESGSSTPTTSTKTAKNVIDLESWGKKAQQKRDAQPKKAGLITDQNKFFQQKQPVANNAEFLAKRKAAQAEQQRQKELALAKAKGAGSGVIGLGNLGADHDSKGQTVMVDSDDEDESEDDLDDDLFGPSNNAKKTLQHRPGLDLSGATGLKPEVKKGPTRISRTARSSKDMRARLKPDLGPLHRVMLSWEFFHNGDYPPGSSERDFLRVTNSFRDPMSYQTTFEPLLLLESWQGMVKSREENANKPYELKVQNRSNVDSFIEISSLLGHQENRELQLSEGDVILISQSKTPADEPDQPHCLARIHRVKRQKAHLEVIYQITPGSSLASKLTMQTIVHGLKVNSITPLEREYGALKGLMYYDLCNQIIRAKPSPKINYSERQVQSYQDVWNLNTAQSQAVNGALDNEGFSLIQGPPGSGKTKTIIAIVGGLLSQTLANTSKGAIRISMPKPNGSTNTIGDAPSKKLLVCAPSNAAVDELVIRLKAGIKTKDGRGHDINVVRIGRSDAINTQVIDVTMEALVTKKLGGSNESEDKKRKATAELFKEHEHISGQLRDLYQRRESGDKMEEKERRELDDSIVHIKRRKAELGSRIDSVKDNERNAGREQELNRKRAQQAVLDQAHVICATLSGSGHDMFQGLSIEFETVIIDEAAQCVEMSSLIPLKYGCVKCIMVGDPKQLPPTVFSKEAAKFQYEQSLFVRMQNNNPDDVHLLDTQYRMHPDISTFPSRTFYDGLLKDGKGMAGLRAKPWHASALLAPYRFFDVRGQHQAAPKGHSLINRAEIEIAHLLYDRLRTDFPTYDFSSSIGIITPYKSQLRELKNSFINRYGQDIFDVIEFNTTDAFQGRESDIIMFSCVRASPAGGIGFLQDIRRMNVGLTRAKSSLWVLGNSESLARGKYWKQLVDDAEARDCYTTGDVRSMLKKPSSAFPASTANTKSMPDVDSHVSRTIGPDSRSDPANGSRRPSTDTSDEPKGMGGKQEITKLPVEVKAEAKTEVKVEVNDPERMDGIRYRFQDRVPNKKAVQDVEMMDAVPEFPDMATDLNDAPASAPRRPSSHAPLTDGASKSESGTPQAGSSSRGSTPLREGSDAGSNAGQVNGKPRSALVPPEGAPPKRIKKRPAQANPFIPKRKPAQR